MLGFLLAIPVILVAGYLIATHGPRARGFGIGAAAGSAMPPLPIEKDFGDDFGDGGGDEFDDVVDDAGEDWKSGTPDGGGGGKDD